MTAAPWGCFIGGRPPSISGAPAISFFCKNSNNQTIPASTWTWLDITTINHETPSGQVSIAADTWTVPQDGHYCITSQIQLSITESYVTVAIEFWRNGVRQCQSTTYNDFIEPQALNLVTSDQMTAGEYWKVRIYHNQFTSCNLNSATCNQNQFTGFCNYLT